MKMFGVVAQMFNNYTGCLAVRDAAWYAEIHGYEPCH